jgi:subtilisin-like proprotein convertase family protein
MQTSRLLPVSLRFLAVAGASLLASSVVGCNQSPTGDDPLTFEEAQVSDLSALMDGAPSNDTLAEEGKADERLPARFDLLAIQSPVRNQGRRGTCTIFSTTALMESLYIQEGTVMNPDFSEQFLQWSTKTELRRFTDGEGSNNEVNLQAISRFGIVTEQDWPYETAAWGVSNDPMCTGEEEMRPTRCFTNGEPPATALMAQRFTLPAGRWINSRGSSIQSYMVNNRLPVVVSGTFFYQAWSHGGSMLPTSAENKRRGIVQYPSAEDQTDSRMRPAGHGILLVGFDNEMRVQRVNGMGQPEVDAMGQPVYDVGFYLFKNSWNNTWATEQVPGTTEHPGGFGWISQRYVAEFMQAYVSGLPRITQREVCDDRRDNDGDGRLDCMDTDCTMAAACAMPTMGETTATPRAAIPDANTMGVSSEINITEPGQIASLAVDVDIAHTYRGDLKIQLEHAGRTVTVVDRQGAGEDNIMEAFSLADFNGTEAMGVWRMTVIDTARADTGTFNSWGLRITRCTGSCGGSTETTRHYENTTARDIPDNDTNGITSEIQATDRGTIRRLTATVTIEHAFPADLRIALQRVGGREVVLFDRQDVTETTFTRTFTVDGFNDQELQGNWRLVVSDRANADTGRLVSWSLDATTR